MFANIDDLRYVFPLFTTRFAEANLVLLIESSLF